VNANQSGELQRHSPNRPACNVATDSNAAAANLRRLAKIAWELGSEKIAEDCGALAERVAAGRFYVACIGQFKRGKSTLLNALVGERILPAGVVPVTSVPTILRYGATRGLRVRFERGEWNEAGIADLAQYVSEELNPENAKGVAAVEVFVPAALLARGMCLVDTPGISSIFEGNTAATREFLPHIDAAIIVLGGDPPITSDELKLIDAIAGQAGELLLVLSKADKCSAGEVEETKEFTRKVLQKRIAMRLGPIFEISAEEQLMGHTSSRDWDKFAKELRELSSESAAELVAGSSEKGIQRIGDALLGIVFEDRNALNRPVEESERRIGELRKTVSNALRSMQDLGYLLASERTRISDIFLEERKKFLAEVSASAHEELDQQMRALPRRYGPKFRRAAMAAAQEIAERRLSPWLKTEQTRAETEYGLLEARFAKIANDFLSGLPAISHTNLTGALSEVSASYGLRARSRFSFERFLTVARPASPLRYMADVAIAPAGGAGWIARDAHEFMDHLLEANSTRVQSDVMNRVQESCRQLESEIRKVLHEVSRISETALENARAALREGAPAVEAKLICLNRLESEILALQHE
jgi:hypothetical protein